MADTPAARLLALLELLQARPTITAGELAAALDVTPRTVRRYVQRLVDLGIPVDSERGPYGGYRLRPGYRLPPLMLTPDEAVAVTLGLMLTGPLGLSAAMPAAAGAIAKLQRVLPDPLRARVGALASAMDVVAPPARSDDIDAELLADLGAAAGRQRQVTLAHVGADGTGTHRTVDPYAVVFRAGRWYLIGHDHLRDAMRTFRVDRIADAAETGRGFARPDDFDPSAHLVAALAAVPYEWTVVVVLHVDIAEARRRVPETIGAVAPHRDGALLELGAASLDWAARWLVRYEMPFTVVRPDELRAALRALSAELLSAADR